MVCGLAAGDLKARDLVVFGSPGMRAGNVNELGTSARVWAAKDPTDWIDRIPHVEVGDLGHGADPADPAFGARRIAADDAAGHAGYFAPGTSSLRTFAAIADGSVRTADDVRTTDGARTTDGSVFTADDVRTAAGARTEGDVR